MFSVHERTQRKICRATFVLACAVPTLLTLSWVCYFHRPWQESDWRASLEGALHVRVEVGKVSAPRPLERSIDGVRFASLKSRQPLVDVSKLSIAANVVTADSLTVHWSHRNDLTESAIVWLTADDFSQIKLHAKSAIIVSGDGAECKLEDLRWESRISNTGTRQLSMQAIHEGKIVRILVERNRDGKVQGTIDSLQPSLPAWLLADILPGSSRWRTATFNGTFQLEMRESLLVGKFRGQISGVDTNEWLAGNQLQTTAKLDFDTLTWRGNRIENVEGTLEATSGRISHAFLALLKEKFLCTVALDDSQLSGAPGFQEIDGLNCHYRLNGTGLAISGEFAWGDREKSCVITSDGKPLVSVPAMPTLPLAQLVQLVSPHSPYWLPATREATSMGEKLPLPAGKTINK